MPELTVDTLALRIRGGTDDPDRISAIALRAIALLGERVERLAARDERTPGEPSGERTIDLASQTDDEAAALIADAWLAALALRLEG